MIWGFSRYFLLLISSLIFQLLVNIENILYDSVFLICSLQPTLLPTWVNVSCALENNMYSAAAGWNIL